MSSAILQEQTSGNGHPPPDLVSTETVTLILKKVEVTQDKVKILLEGSNMGMDSIREVKRLLDLQCDLVEVAFKPAKS
jgi:hypothetical protein